MQARYFHDSNLPENVMQSYHDGELQHMVDDACHRLGVHPPKVRLINDPKHVYTSYYECVKAILISKAALIKLPKYAWAAMIASGVAYHYALDDNFHFASKTERGIFADEFAAKLTSPQAVIRALQYFQTYYDPSHPDDAASDKKRIAILKKYQSLQNSVLNQFSTAFSNNPTSATQANENKATREKLKNSILHNITNGVGSNTPSQPASATPDTTKASSTTGHKAEKQLKTIENTKRKQTETTIENQLFNSIDNHNATKKQTIKKQKKNYNL